MNKKTQPKFNPFTIILIVIVSLFVAGVFILGKQQQIQEKEPSNAATGTVTISNGNFYESGKLFYAAGTTWWASYQNSPNYTIDKPGAGAFENPYYKDNLTVVEAELSDMQALGYNTLSVVWPIYQTTATEHSDIIVNFTDFLARVKNHGMRISTYLPTCDVFPTSFNSFNEQKCLWQIQDIRTRVAPADLFAVEVAWEPGTSEDYTKRVQLLDAAWKKWIQDQYGSFDVAIQQWGYNSITLPTNAQLVSSASDGQGDPIPKIRAYKRFLVDYYAPQVANITDKIRAIAPGLLISGRTSQTVGYMDAFPLDTIAKAFDFIGLESYALPVNSVDNLNSADEFLKNGFYIEWARMISSNKPVIFYEFGYNTLDDTCRTIQRAKDPACLIANPQSKQLTQQKFYTYMYNLALKTNVNGMLHWFYAGKRPVFVSNDGEFSDFGIRQLPALGVTSGLGEKKLVYDTQALNLPKFKAKNGLIPYTADILVDTDLFSNEQFYFTGGNAFLNLIKQGKYARARTEGTGTNSNNVPNVCIGNKPRIAQCPHKYLNAYFNYIEVRNSQGIWQRVTDGATVTARIGQPLLVRLKVSNNGQSTWLPTGINGKGIVQLGVDERYSTFTTRYSITGAVSPNQDSTLSNVQLLAAVTKNEKMILQMLDSQTAWFGQRITINITAVNVQQIPAPPTGLKFSCAPDGSKATVSWTPAAGASVYALRINDTQNGWTGSCTNVNGGDVCSDSVTTTSYTFDTVAKATYSWWVHAGNASGFSTQTNGPTFTCAVPTPIPSRSPSASPSPTRSPSPPPSHTASPTPAPSRSPSPTATQSPTATPIAYGCTNMNFFSVNKPIGYSFTKSCMQVPSAMYSDDPRFTFFLLPNQVNAIPYVQTGNVIEKEDKNLQWGINLSVPSQVYVMYRKIPGQVPPAWLSNPSQGYTKITNDDYTNLQQFVLRKNADGLIGLYDIYKRQNTQQGTVNFYPASDSTVTAYSMYLVAVRPL